MEHYKVYQEILDKLPSTKSENAENILSEYEKKIVKEELEKFMRRPK